MTTFAFQPVSDSLRNIYLKHLQLKPQNPSLEFLNQLIRRHQERVPFENFTRISDFHDFKNHLPPIDIFIQRLEAGAGGVCWTMARGFGWLLKNLNFDVEYLYMDPGHVCLKVRLDQDYYVDVGYGAPFFEAFPLKQSFQVKAPSETFSYQVQGETVDVVRTPGPHKTLHLQPVAPAVIDEKFRIGNQWGKNRFLTMLLISKYENGNQIRIANQKFQHFTAESLIEQELSGPDMVEKLRSVFGIHPAFYERASQILRQDTVTSSQN